MVAGKGAAMWGRESCNDYGASIGVSRIAASIGVSRIAASIGVSRIAASIGVSRNHITVM